MSQRKARHRARRGRNPSVLTQRRGADHRVDRPIWLYGAHPVAAALANPARRCHRLVALNADVAPESGNWQAEIIDRQTLEALLPPDAVHQGVALLADPLPDVDLASVYAGASEDAIVVVLDRVTDPHNVGAIIRSAAAFGALAVMAQDRHAPPVTGALAKAAAGALERVALVRVGNLAATLGALKDAGFWCLGLDLGGDTALADAPSAGRRALILGAEGAGMRRLTRESCDHLIHIPMSQDAESLNVSNAAAIALYVLAGPPHRY